MLVAIGILIILLLIIVIFYQALIAEKVKVEDAEEALRIHLKNEWQLEGSNIQSQLKEWEVKGLELDKETYYLLDMYEYRLNNYRIKAESFPYSLLSEIFKKKLN